MSDDQIVLTSFDDVKLADGIKDTFKDVSAEERRTYKWSGGEEYTINFPIALRVSESGTHYVVDAYAETHCIPTGWIVLKWKNEDNQNHVDF